MKAITVREASTADVGNIQSLQTQSDVQAALSRAELRAFLRDRSCGGWLVEHQGSVVGCLLYRADWPANRIAVWHLAEQAGPPEWAVRERLLLRLLVLAQTFAGLTVLVPARPQDHELVQLLEGLRFCAVEERDGLLWFCRQPRQPPPDETADAGGRTHFTS